MPYSKFSTRVLMLSTLLLASTPTIAKTITFKNNAGYVAELKAMVWVNQKHDGQMVPVMEVLESGKIAIGQTRVIELQGLNKEIPITVEIHGVAAIGNPVMIKTLPANFYKDACFEATGTIFNGEGDYCDGGAPILEPQQTGSAQAQDKTPAGRANMIAPNGPLYNGGMYTVGDGQFSTKEGKVPPACLGQLITEYNGDDTVAAIFLNRSNIRGCIASNIPYPGGDENAVSYTIKKSYPGDKFHVEICQNTGGNMGPNCGNVEVQFVNRQYHRKGKSSNVLSLEKLGEW